MNHLLTLAELSVDDVLAILHEAERFANGETWKVNKQTFVANLFLSRARERVAALKWRNENLDLKSFRLMQICRASKRRNVV